MITSRICCKSLLTAMAFTAGCASPWRPVASSGPAGTYEAGRFPPPQEIVIPGDPPATSTNRLPGTQRNGSELNNSPAPTGNQPVTPYATQRPSTQPPAAQPPVTVTPKQQPGEWRAAPKANPSTLTPPPQAQPNDAPLFRPDPQDVKSWKPIEKPIDTQSTPFEGTNHPLPPESETNSGGQSSPVNPRLDTPKATLQVPFGNVTDPPARPVTQEGGASRDTATSTTVELGKSTQGSRIAAARFGKDGLRVMILGSLNGNEADTVKFVESVGVSLLQSPEIVRGRSLLILPTPNPDGLQEGTLTNSRGVNLNRNFPSPRFTTRPTTVTGPYPASEPETQALVETMNTFRPHRVVMVQTGAGERAVLTANARAIEGLRLRATGQGLTINHFDNLFKIGSIEEYVSRELKAEMIVINLPLNSAELQDDPSSLLNLVVDGASPDESLDPLSNRSDHSTVGSSRTLDSRSENQQPPHGDNSGKPDGEKGYVTLLPPPPEFAEGEDDPRYFELPPP